VKVLFLTDGIHPFQLGGMQKHSLVLSKLLALNGVKLQVYHCGGQDYSQELFMSAYKDAADHVQESMIPFPKLDKLPGHYIRENKRYSQMIYEDVKSKLGEFDLIYAQGFTAWHFIKEKKKGQFKVPVVVNFHGFEMFQDPPSKKVWLEYKFFKSAVKYNVLNADYVYSFGGKIDKILSEIGVPKERILLQSNGIESSWLAGQQANNKRNQRFTLTFIGRNERRKGIEELNKALKELIKRKDLGFRFNFIGPIPASEQLKDDRIIYHGELRSSGAIKDILIQSDVLVCPSHSEGMPTVILEGMACGLAIIATDVGAVSRQVQGNGILLEKPDPKKLRNAMFRLINLNVDELSKMKFKSQELVQQKFIWEAVVASKIKNFKNITNLP
jgi:glycosyltransferase involved in cell wall biosynthesis